ncbi:MAG: hypothetical protein HKN16_12260 [Saprospiraceae bacterium]|nr:hypothetical protein [Saprospiraceae bacterium]
MMRNSLIAFLIFSILGCSGQSAQGPPEKAFFDLARYFEDQIAKGEGRPLGVSKTTLVDEDIQEVVVEEVDLKKELKLFAESDINKIAWIEKYRSDTLTISENHQRVIYECLDTELRTQRVEIDFLGDYVGAINIHNRLKSMIMDTDQYLSYKPEIGYSVEIRQQGKLQKGHHYKTEAVFGN